MKSIQEAAEIFGVSRQTIWLWIQLKKLKAEKVGKTYVIADKEIARVKERQA